MLFKKKYSYYEILELLINTVRLFYIQVTSFSHYNRKKKYMNYFLDNFFPLKNIFHQKIILLHGFFFIK